MIIFIYGEDSYSASQRLKAMKDRFVEKFDPSGMNVIEFSDRTLEIGSIAQSIQSPGFLSAKRMVIVRGLLAKITKKPDAKPWLEQLSKAPADSILILFDPTSEKKIEKNEIYKQLLKLEDVHAYACPALVDEELTKWAMNESGRIGLKIGARQLDKVIGLVGSDLWQLSGELAKLAAYANGHSVDENMIDLLVKANFEDRMFDFIDAVAQKQTKRALALLDDQRQSGSTDFHLFGMLSRQVRLLIGARDVLDQNPRATKQDVADALGVHPFVAQKTLSQARAFSSDQLHGLHDRLFDFDRRVKTGGASMDIVVDRVVAELIS